MKLEKPLKCPYEQVCALHTSQRKEAPIIIFNSSEEEKYICRNDVSIVDNCAYLHQLENEDKQIALLEKILMELRPKRVGKINPKDFENIDQSLDF